MPQELPLISVIVPVYKVEEYLDQCVESIVGQTYKNLEIILVDDGSPDKCPRMCDDWAKKDSRIKVVHKVNGGVSDARNVGIECAQGEFIIFVDSDDLISEDMLSTFYFCCENNSVLVAMCPLQNFAKENPSLKAVGGNIGLLTGRFICAHFFDYYASGPVAKLFHKSLLEKVRFPLNRRAGEDAAFNYPIFYAQKNVAYVYKAMYFYRHYAESTTGSYNVCLMDELLTLEEMLDFYKERKECDLYDAMLIEYFARILAHENKVKKYLTDGEKLLSGLEIKKENLLHSCPVSLRKIGIYLASLFPRVFLKIYFGWHDYQQKLLKEKK